MNFLPCKLKRCIALLRELMRFAGNDYANAVVSLSISTYTEVRNMRHSRHTSSQFGRYSEYMHKQALIRLLVLGVLVFIVAIGIGGLRVSLEAIRRVDPSIVVTAAGMIFLSYLCATLTYMLLAIRRIGLAATLMIQISTGLVNRLLPAGLGGLGINAYYLRKRGHSVATALTIVAMNNTLGFAGNMTLMLIAIAFFPVDLTLIKLPDFSPIVTFAVFVIVLAMALYLKRHHRMAYRLGRSLGEAKTYILAASRRPLRTFLALVSSMTLTGLHAAALYMVLFAVNVSVPPSVALLAISVGAFAGAALPTPGGLGGAEAGIAGALMAFSVSPADAITAALIYRVITYWLPLVPGYFALRIAEKRYLY